MKEFDALVDVVRTLRAPNGCEWDKAQTEESLIPYMVEEIYEFIDALDSKQHDEQQKELGDVFLHLVFQGLLAEEKNNFKLEDVFTSITEKLIRRHPHIFADKKFLSLDEQNNHWEKQKLKEGRQHILDGLPVNLPALHKAYRIQEKVAAVGFDWEKTSEVWDKIDEEMAELKEAIENKDPAHIEEELGDLIFSIVNLSRFISTNPDEALRKANSKFTKRFNRLENLVIKSDRPMTDYSLDELEQLWKHIKQER